MSDLVQSWTFVKVLDDLLKIRLAEGLEVCLCYVLIQQINTGRIIHKNVKIPQLMDTFKLFNGVN